MASTNANRLIYYFKRIPFLGRLLPERIYRNLALKKNAAILAFILKVIRKVMGDALMIAILLVVPVCLLETNQNGRYAEYLHVFLMINAIAPFLTSSIFNANRDQYICIQLMHINAKDYIVSTVLLHEIGDIFYLLPSVLFATVWMGGTLLHGFLLTALLVGFSLIGETFFLLFYCKTNIMLNKKAQFVVPVGILCLASAYIPLVLHRPLPLENLLFHPLFLILMLALCTGCVLIILRCNQYHKIASKNLKAFKFMLNGDEILAKAEFDDVALKEKNFSKSDLQSKKFEKKKGFAYLNAIFFERHKLLLVKPVLIRIVCIAILWVAAVIASHFIPDFADKFSNANAILPLFVFVMYFLSLGERICKAMFLNCDISLLRYPFYREKNAILSNFKVRLFEIAKLNFVVAFAVSAAVLGLALVCRLNWPTSSMLLFVLSIFSLSLLFSIHHLFLYYVFQPFTAELGMKNPFYSIIHYAVFFLCYLCTKIKSPPSFFTLTVLAVTLIYMVAAVILVYKLAPKNFRVK
jgi:hypothetical protein